MMLANQQSYERGLEDLKLTFDALIDEIKHSSAKRLVGDLLVEIYDAYITRRGLCEKLKAQIKDICPTPICGSLEDAG